MDSSDCPSTSSTAFGVRGYWRFETPSVLFVAFSATFASSAVTLRHPELSKGEDRAEEVFCKIRVDSWLPCFPRSLNEQIAGDSLR
jgi:hypothetical protein